MSSSDPDAMLELGASMMQIKAAMRFLKDMCRSNSTAIHGMHQPQLSGAATAGSTLAAQRPGSGDSAQAADDAVPNKGVYALQDEAKKLRLQVCSLLGSS